MKTSVTLAALLVSVVVAPHSPAGQYPSRPVKLIVGFEPGGPTDLVSRLIARKLSEALGQRVIVENRPGASGTIAARAAAQAPADGHTLFVGTTGSLASAPSLYPNLGYDPLKSFAPVSRLINSPFLVVAHPSLPANSLRELIDLARSKPGQLNYGSVGNGNPTHIAGEMFQTAADVKLMHVPYKGTGAALTDFLPGRLQLMFHPPAALLPHLRSGKLKAIAVAAPTRLAQLPDVPTTAEAGLPSYQVSVWFGLVAPSGTPDAVVQRLNEEVRKALASREVRDVLSDNGFEPASSSREEFSALIRSDGDKWARAVKASGAILE